MTHQDDPSIQIVYEREYSAWEETLDGLARELAARLDEAGLRYQLRHRIKGLGSLIERLRSKGRVNDLLGLRVIVPFQEHIEIVVELLCRHWRAVEVERKAESLSFREFGYDSVHVLVPISERLAKELPGKCRSVVEVQVRTTLQDAWAEVEHELVYKSPLRFPREGVRKKLAARNALLTLADVTFQEIRDQQAELAEWGRERFHELKLRAANPVALEDVGEAVTKVGGGTPPAVFTYPAGGALEQVLLDGLIAHREHDHRRAVDRYTQALELRPEPSIRSVIYNHRGMALFSLSDEVGALRDFEKAVKWDPSNHGALLNRALAWRRLGQVEEALLDLARAAEAGAELRETLYLRAQTYAEMGRHEEALSDLASLLELEPDREDARTLLERLQAPRR